MNRLSNEKSPYLRHAAEQPIDWYPWSDEPFLRAEQEGKAVFLSSGGVWCHWCHVMAKESFENDEIATLLNELFISVKLDRDERPDIDRRYQQAVAIMGGGGGWPLSVFLTPDRRPFFGGTYFPPDDRYGRPGFIKVLRSVHEFYQSRKGEAVAYGVRIMDALKSEVLEAGELNRDSLEQAKIAILAHFDAQHGGFGASPKFPMPGALEFLLHQAATRKDPSAENAVKTTLDAMARGGFHDHLAGGFHRYSVDEAWFVPHFEKMADDNAWLLRNYIDAYALFGEERYKEVATGIIRFVRSVLSDPEGRFFASQDADVTPDDEGGYFTWTDEDFKRVLTIDEYQVLSLRFFHERGALPHDQAKKVLCISREIPDIAATLGMSREAVDAIIARGKEKLLAERNGREMPFVDRTLYTSLNGMFITSFLKAYRVLGDAGLRDFALTSLDRILKERFIDGMLYHTEGIPAVLDDHIYLIESLIAAYESTGERARLDAATAFMDRCLERFADSGGGFFDTEKEVLGTRLKRVEDIPHPSANAISALLLIKLFHLTGREQYRSQAEKILRIFSVAVKEMSIHAGTYYCALDAWFTVLKLTVEATPDCDLAIAARRLTGPYTVVVYGENKERVVPCLGETCHAPVTSSEDLVCVASQLTS